ncbi:hypothetical protein [Paenibacillus elgii]|uniref:hypothetical protein n=1 Tax=Paenibacillus elgii TaxID=189691 RepID=UPI0013D08D7C|nr:hypothetical protein [Paenibacillus elgii]
MTPLILLNNRKRKVHHEPTKAVVVSYSFLKALFSIEENYDDKEERFRFRSNGKSRLLNHIARADLQLATTLQVCFSTEGRLEFVNRHMVYRKLQELYERPCNKDQFYAAFDKFVRHGLVRESRDSVTGLYQYELSNYLDDKTNKIGRFIMMHPVVFTESFTRLPLAMQKMFYYAVAQQGNQHRKLLEWNLTGGLHPFVHFQELYQTKLLMRRMFEERVYEGNALFAHARLERNSIGGLKAVFAVNPKFLISHEKGMQYHEVVPAKKGYRRIALQLKDMLAQLGIGEFEHVAGGLHFMQLVRLLRDKSRAYIRFVVDKIKVLYERHRIFPDHILEYIQQELRSKTLITILDIAKKTGVHDFITAGCGESVRDDRLATFASAVSHLDINTFRSLCKRAATILKKEHTRPPAKSEAVYITVRTLERVLDMSNLRSRAFMLQKDPDAYRFLEYAAETKLQKGQDKRSVRQWLLREIEKLPHWMLIPDPPKHFSLEQYLLKLHTS